MKVKLSEMTWPEVRELSNRANVVLIPVGSTEQHGHHLPLDVDSLTAAHVAEQAALKVAREHEVHPVVAPTIDYADVSVHKRFPGTVGVKVETFIRMVVDIVEGFLEQGFNRIVTVNSHVQNTCSIEAALRIVADRRPGAHLFATNTPGGLGASVRGDLVKGGVLGDGHALEIETSIYLALRPDAVRLDRAVTGSRQLPLPEKFIGPSGSDKSKGVVYYTGATGFEESGTFGDPSLASREAGERVLSAMIDDLAEIVVEVVRANA